MQDLIFKDLIPVPTGTLGVQSFSNITQLNNKVIELSLIIPTYNESQNIQQLITVVIQILNPILPNKYELIVVDDNSCDRTWKLALELTQEYPQVRVMRRELEKGLATAVIRGWQAAQGRVLGVIDADLQHPPQILIKLWQEIAKGADIAIASRHIEGGGVSEWSMARRFLSRGAQMLGLLILPEVMGRISDPMSGYFMVRRDALSGTIFQPLGYKVLVEVMARGKMRWIGEVGYIFQERKTGESKVTSQQYLEYVRHLVRLRLDLWQIDRFLNGANAPALRSNFEPIGSVSLMGETPALDSSFNAGNPTRGASSRRSRPTHSLRNGLSRKIAPHRFIRFGISGFSGVFVNLGVLYLLREFIDLGLTRSAIMAGEVAIANNFWWNDRWTFKDISNQQKGNKKRLRRFLKFNLICLSGLILNVLVLNIFYNLFDINEYIANIMAIALVTFWNFWFNLKLNWRSTNL
jgi:dolichol-phosphate mannosyltransferase